MHTVTNHSTGTARANDLRLENLTDPELYALCKKYGLQARLWRQKFAGTLPEVAKRELHKKRGYSSIYEFAGKLSGMSHEATNKVLRIAVKIEDKPALKQLLVSGEQGWSKIEKVAWVATKETDEKWAEKVKSMPQQALEVFVQEYRKNQQAIGSNEQNSELHDDITLKSRTAEQIESIANEGYGHFYENNWNTLSFAVSPETEFQLRCLKQAIEKEKKVTLTWNEFMEEIVKKCKKPEKDKAYAKQNASEEVTSSRRIPTAIQREVKEKYNGHCAYPNCKNAPSILHHIKRFAIDGSHDPKLIVPICKKHERLAHTGEIVNENSDSEKWKTGDLSYKEKLNETEEGKQKLKIDEKVSMYRRWWNDV